MIVPNPQFYLSESELSFLQKHFDVYESDTKSIHHDFQSVTNSQVIFIGEAHHQKDLQDAQAIAIPIFARNQQTLLPLEASPFNCRVPHPHLTTLPWNIQFLGVDSRVKLSEVLNVAWRKLKWEQTRVEYHIKKENKIVSQKVCSILNAEFNEKRAFIYNNSIITNSETINKIIIIYNTLKNYLENLKQIKIKLRIIESCTIPQEIAQIEQSNTYLTEAIVQYAPSFQKIIPIWGISHFVAGTAMLETLKKRKISYSIILHKISESKHDNPPMADLTLKYPNQNPVQSINTVTLKIPHYSKKWLHREIVPLLGPTPRSLYLDGKSLSDLLESNNPIQIQNCTLFVTGVTEQTYLAFAEKHFKSDLSILLKTIDQMLTPQGWQTEFVAANISYVHGRSVDGKLTLCFNLSSDAIIKARRTPLWTTTTELFEQMTIQQKNWMTLLPGQSLGFTDFTPADHNAISSIGPMHWISTKAPQNRNVAIEGTASIQSSILGDNHAVLQLRPATANPIHLHLTRLTPPEI